MAVTAGLCTSCVHVKLIPSARGSVFYQCQLSFSDPRFPKYPRLPVLECVGYQSQERQVNRMDASEPEA
jgi:hypothetical protein